MNLVIDFIGTPSCGSLSGGALERMYVGCVTVATVGRRAGNVLDAHGEDDAAMKQISQKTVDKPSYFRLVEATSALWMECGYAAMSARQISAMADAPVSSIYHHFGSLEQLFAISQRACLARAKAWCDAELEQVADLDMGLEGFAGFFAHIVDDWTENHRPLAFAWRECELLAARNPQFMEQTRLWRMMWHDFWARAGEIFGLGGNAFIAERLFDTESLLHLIRWRRVMDRAALSETAQAIACWLAGKPPLATPWRTKAHAEALHTSTQTMERDEIVGRIMQAAAQQVSAHGIAGVTHRAIAERAGLTLGAVSHRFRTKAALLDAAFEGLYSAINAPTIRRQQPSVPPTAQAISDDIMRTKQNAEIVGADDLFLVAARDPALGSFGAQLRYLRGRSSLATLQAALGSQHKVSLIEGALFSGFISAQIRRNNHDRQDGGAPVHDELLALISLLGAGNSPLKRS